MNPASPRIHSIDRFRALTMFLMIFVNDFWTLRNIPEWLGHAAASEDRLGFSDVIFPAFLFIVGLSIPYSMSRRLAKNEKLTATLSHIAGRTAALLLMGLFLVNLENINTHSMEVPVWIWRLLLITAFFLVWNQYPSGAPLAKPLKIAGYILLVILAATYKGGTPAEPAWMKVHWWGILGLIGWSYLVGSLVYLAFSDRLWPTAIAWLSLGAINIISFRDLPGWLDTLRQYVWPVGEGALPAMTVAGVLTSVMLRSPRISKRRLSLILGLLGIGCVLAGIALRPEEGISKIRATPAWTAVCTGISLLVFLLLDYSDEEGREPLWARWLKPAGAAALTCYLVPYVVYTLADLSGIRLPAAMLTGGVGLVKSAAYAALVVGMTGLLIRKGIRLKI